MRRRPTTQDLTWLIDLHKNNQLDIDPPYQRRSVWTRGDRQFFLDTIFRNFPSPAIFLHKTIDGEGNATYHVVDGKQRTQTIIDFVNDRIRIAKEYGDVRLDGKKWSQLQGEPSLKQAFWNYQITIEMMDAVEEGSVVVNEVFDRLNRNSRKLTAQELRHAKFDGWLIKTAEAESNGDEWRELGIVTTARARRMLDTQFISELMLVLLEDKVIGFDQDVLNELYAKYDDPQDSATGLNEDAFHRRFSATKAFLLKIERETKVVSQFANGFGNFYTLWSFVALAKKRPSPPTLAPRYESFMQKVEKLGEQKDLDAFLRGQPAKKYALALAYHTNSRGASTDLGPRSGRLTALSSALLNTKE